MRAARRAGGRDRSASARGPCRGRRTRWHAAMASASPRQRAAKRILPLRDSASHQRHRYAFTAASGRRWSKPFAARRPRDHGRGPPWRSPLSITASSPHRGTRHRSGGRRSPAKASRRNRSAGAAPNTIRKNGSDSGGNRVAAASPRGRRGAGQVGHAAAFPAGGKPRSIGSSPKADCCLRRRPKRATRWPTPVHARRLGARLGRDSGTWAIRLLCSVYVPPVQGESSYPSHLADEEGKGS